MAKHGEIDPQLLKQLSGLVQSPTPDAMVAIENTTGYKALMENYTQYVGKTLAGDHGSTAKYWMGYARQVQVFMLFSRAYRTNDLELFTYALMEMIPLFFATHRPNYARWMVKFMLNLLNIDNTHPGLKEILEGGGLSVRRTSKSFSRTQIDITLEQTVNADAASRQTGISAFSCNESARQRWMITRCVRSSIIGNLMQQAGLKKEEDISKELKPHKIIKNSNDLEDIINRIRTTMNPFNQELDENLYCLTSWKKLPEEIKKDLLNANETGKIWFDEFRSECKNDPERFERPIRRRKVKNFPQAAAKCKIPVNEKKLLEIQGTRDLFGRLLYLSTVQQVDMHKVLQYPLTPVPLALAHLDGMIYKTDV